MTTLTEELDELENVKDPTSDLAIRLLTSFMASAKLSTMSNRQIASLLLHYIWSDMDITSPQAVLIHEAIQRLDKGLAGSSPEDALELEVGQSGPVW